MKCTKLKRNITFEAWARQGTSLVKKIRKQQQEQMLKSTKREITATEVRDMIDDASSMDSTLTTLSSKRCQQKGICTVVKGFDDLSDQKNILEIQGEGDCRFEMTPDDGMEAFSVKEDKCQPIDASKTKEERQLEEHGTCEEGPKLTSSPLWGTRTFSKRVTFRGSFRAAARKKKESRSLVPEENDVSVCISHFGNGGPCFGLLEGIVDMMQDDEEDELPNNGRIHEMAPLNSMLEGKWRIRETFFHSDSVHCQPMTRKSKEGDRSMCLTLRHHAFFSEEHTNLDPDSPLSSMSHESLELRMVDPALTRDREMINQSVVDREDLCFVKVTSLSLLAFEGFSSSSESCVRSRELAQSVLAHLNTKTSRTSNLHSFQVQNEMLGNVVGATYILPAEEKICYYLVLAVDRESQKIVAADVIFPKDKKIPLFARGSEIELSRALLTKRKLEQHGLGNDTYPLGASIKKRPRSKSCQLSLPGNATCASDTRPPTKRQESNKNNNSNHQQPDQAGTPSTGPSTQSTESHGTKHSSSKLSNIETTLPQQKVMDTNEPQSIKPIILRRNPGQQGDPKSRTSDDHCRLAPEFMNRGTGQLPSTKHESKLIVAVPPNQGRTDSPTAGRLESQKLGLPDSDPHVRFALEPMEMIFPSSQKENPIHPVATTSLAMCTEHATPSTAPARNLVSDFRSPHDDDDPRAEDIPIDPEDINTTEDPTNLEDFTLFHDVFFGCHDEYEIFHHKTNGRLGFSAAMLHGFCNTNDDGDEALGLWVDWLVPILLLALLFALLYWINVILLDDPWEMLHTEATQEPESSATSFLWYMLRYQH